MKRSRYWINTFYSYIRKDRGRILLTVIVGGVSLYIISFALTILNQATKNDRNYRTYIYISSRIPQGELERLKKFISTTYHDVEITIQTPEEKLKKLLNGEKVMEDIVKLLPITLIVSSTRPLPTIRLPEESRKYVIRQTSVAPGEKELREITSMVKTFLIFLSSTLILGVAIIIIFTLHLSFMSHKREIEILKLLGASNFFISIPLYLEGIFIGGVSGLTGVLLINLTTIWLRQAHIPLTWLVPHNDSQVMILTAGILLGFISSFVGILVQSNDDEA